MRRVIWVILLVLLIVSSVQAYSKQPNSLNTAICDQVTVQAGDTVWNIAARYQMSREDVRDIVMAIRIANGLNANSQIEVGQVLKIPARAK